MIARAAFLALAPLTAAAQSDPEAAVLPRLIDTGCFELVDALNGCEQVTLLVSQTAPDSADLFIYPDRRTDASQGPLLVLRSAVFNGALWGMAPVLEPISGGFRLRSEQSGIGRFPWFESIDVAHDGQSFVVTAYSFSAYDRALPRNVSCDVDFRTGDYLAELWVEDPEDEAAEPVITSERGSGTPGPRPLSSWTIDAPRPEICMRISEGLYTP